jgi:hypothetical protein
MAVETVRRNEGGARGRSSDRHDLGFLGLHELVDLGDVLVGQLLDVVAGTTLVVFGDFLVLDELLERFVGVATQVADATLPSRLRS